MCLWWVDDDFMIGRAVQGLLCAKQAMLPLLLPEGTP